MSKAMFHPFRLIRKLYLASSSPRRRVFLSGLGLNYQTLTYSNCEPKPDPGEEPADYVRRAARAKAEQALAENPGMDGALLAADTIVVLPENGRILGKPASHGQAFAMLRTLSGRGHSVLTACCLHLENGRSIEFCDLTNVYFSNWPDRVLSAYVKSGNPLDKAGAYGIQEQGSFLVERIEGSWSTVVGLPVSLLVKVLLEQNIIEPVTSGE